MDERGRGRAGASPVQLAAISARREAAGKPPLRTDEAPTDEELEETAPPPPAEAAESTTYVVQFGDTLGQIAIDNNTSVDAIMELNPSITDPDVIYIGQEITLP